MSRTNKEKEAVLDVFAGMVRPLMRVAFEYGISASEIAGVVRRAYIQALEARLKDQKRPTTDARLAAVAGLPKSDVSALRDALRAGAPLSLRTAVSLDQIASLLTAWHTHANFSGAYGLPMDLDLVPVPGSPRKSFAELVTTACPEADSEALIDELVAAGSVEVIDGTTARCLSRAYVPRGGDTTRIERMGRYLGVVSQSLVHNLLRAESDPGYFERTVVSDELLSDSGRDQFLELSGEKCQELLAELDTALTRIASTEGSPAGKKYGVGVYFFEEAATAMEIAAQQQRVPRPRHEGNLKVAPMEEIDVLANLPRKD
ncbi:MAG TPA: DUF6502 family protein [Steroidobacteraceae bacterium]